MKLGASATSPGVTARWEYVPGGLCRLRRGKAIGGLVGRFGGRMWSAWAYKRGDLGYFTHRYQAKRAVEAAVSQALREAVE